MSLDQAIKHGKEHRKSYRGAKAVDSWCRNHGYCWICRGNRLHKNRIAEEEIKNLKKISKLLNGENEREEE